MNEALVAGLRPALAGRTQVRLAIPFGSAARGSDRETSDVDVVAAKLAELENRLVRVSSHRHGSAEAQTRLDVASHTISDEGWPPASTLADSFHRLAERGVITSVNDAALGRAASFRSFVAHGYGRVAADLPYAAATEGVGDLERFACEVAGWIARGDT